MSTIIIWEWQVGRFAGVITKIYEFGKMFSDAGLAWTSTVMWTG